MVIICKKTGAYPNYFMEYFPGPSYNEKRGTFKVRILIVCFSLWPWQMRNRNIYEYGFSLLELFAVIACIGILATVVGPSVKTYLAAINLLSATNSIKQQLILAKTKAMGDPNVHCGIYFDSSVTPNQTRSFLDNAPFYQYTGVDAPYMPVYAMPKNVTISVGGTGADKVMVFRGDGSAKTGTPGISQNKIVVTITVISKGGTFIKSKTISVLPSTGRIKVQ